MPIDERINTGETLEILLGACLQASLERYGSGLEGTQLTEELNQLLAMVRLKFACLCKFISFLQVMNSYNGG